MKVLSTILAPYLFIYSFIYFSAMLKVGDNHWYGKTVPQNITFAGEMYAEAAAKNDLPQVTIYSSGGFFLSYCRS